MPDEVEVEACCSHCGSTNLRYVEGEYETGVYAPDGYAETWSYKGHRCLDCGTLEEE